MTSTTNGAGHPAFSVSAGACGCSGISSGEIFPSCSAHCLLIVLTSFYRAYNFIPPALIKRFCKKPSTLRGPKLRTFSLTS